MTSIHHDPSPFGDGGGPRRRLGRRALLIGVPVITLAGVWLATRGSSAEQAAAAHNHGAAAGGDTTRPVMLSGDEARRIGVTYTLATMGPMGRDVRTVGQVTFDETKVIAWTVALLTDSAGSAGAATAPA